MDPVTISAIAGFAMSAAGTGMGFSASKKTEAANEQAIAAQQKAEAIRMKAMEFDASRRRREIIRQAQIARSYALATGVNQGASKGSGLQGAFGQILGKAGFDLEGVEGQLGFGREMFAANTELLAARRAGASADTQKATAQGLTSLGGQIISNLGAIDRLGNTYLPKAGGGVQGYGSWVRGMGSNGIY